MTQSVVAACSTHFQENQPSGGLSSNDGTSDQIAAAHARKPWAETVPKKPYQKNRTKKNRTKKTITIKTVSKKQYQKNITKIKTVP